MQGTLLVQQVHAKKYYVFEFQFKVSTSWVQSTVVV